MIKFAAYMVTWMIAINGINYLISDKLLAMAVFGAMMYIYHSIEDRIL